MAENVFEDVRTYYVFLLADELFALDTSIIKGTKVGYQLLSKSVANLNSHIVGMLDWGSECIQVIDLRLIYGTQKTPIKSQTDMVIIVEVISFEQRIRVGFVIDSYLDIENIKVKDIKSTNLWTPAIKKMFLSNRFSQNRQLVKIIEPVEILANTKRQHNISLDNRHRSTH